MNILTDRETRALILSVLEARRLAGRPGATEDELEVVIDWATQTRLDMAALDLALDGKLLLDVRGGEVTFNLAKHLVRQREEVAGVAR